MSKKNGDLITRKRGRPPILEVSPGIKDEIIKYISDGAYMQTAFRAAGVSDQTYDLWLRKAEQGIPIYSEFIAKLKKAEAEAELKISQQMMLGGNHFLPSATFLERRFRDRWGRSDRRTVDANVNITIASVNYNQLLKQMRKQVDDKD